MLLNKEYYYEMIKKYTAIVLSLFKHLKYYYVDEDNNGGFKDVNVIYSQSEKYLKDIIGKIETDQNIARKLPILTVTLTDIQSNTTVRRNPYQKFDKVCKDGSVSMYAPIPYKFMYSVEVLTKKSGTGASIIEQILPYFTPDFTIPAQELKDKKIINDVVITLKATSLTIDNEFTTAYDSTKYFLTSFDLEVRGNLYKPISDASLIETVYINVKNYKDTVNLDENDILINIVEPEK